MSIYLPIKQGAKTPAVSGWAKPDYAGVEPVGRVGLRADGLVIVDCDSLAAANAWIRRIGCDPDDFPTRTHRTPRGFHFLYHWTEGSPMGPLVNVLPGTDIRSGMGSYIVCPPTPGYVVLNPEGDIKDFDPSQLPERETPAEAEEGWTEIPEGQRNATLASVAGSMRKQGASAPTIATYLHGMNNTFCHPPLPAEEIVAIAQSVGRYEPVPDVTILLDEEELERPEDLDEDLPDEFYAEELMSFDMPDTQWTVPGFIPEGLTILGGRPKVGKSWFALDLALSVAEGGTFLGEEVEQGKVIYLALEDNHRRLKKRLGKLLDGRQLPPPEQFRFAINWPRLPEGGRRLAKWLKQHEDTRLVIVDTFALVRAPASERQAGTYQDDYGALGVLKQISDYLGITVLVIHHQRKSDADDVLDTISGTTGLTGAADTILVLTKEALKGRGRDLEGDLDRAMTFNEETARWRAGDHQSIKVVQELGDWIMEHSLPGDPVPSRSFLAGLEHWTQGELKKQLAELRTDHRFESASAHSTLYRRDPNRPALTEGAP